MNGRSGTGEPILVRVADWAIADGGAIIATLGLGSCVAIMVYDARARVGAMAHILLPDLAMSRDHSNPAKFPATAVPLLIEALTQRGALGPLSAKIAGGSSMFASLLPKSGINMGERNIAATKRALEVAKIPLIAHDTGGDYGRSVYLNTADGSVFVRSLKRGSRDL